MNNPFNVLDSKYPDIRFELYTKEKDKSVYLTGFIVPQSMRNQGVGSDFMDDLIKIADGDGWKITLTPSSSYGGNVNRLKKFYKEFGFVENKGQNRDFTHKEDMYREPKNMGTEETITEKVVGDKIECNKCDWSWDIKDGGDDLYVCHKCGNDNTPKLNENVNRLKQIITLTEEKKPKADRCLRIARRKYDKPSAYRSGAIVRCRNGKIWKDLKEDDINEAPEDIKELLYQAHEAITSVEGEDYAPNIHELEGWVKNHINEYNTFTGEEVAQHIKDITPEESDIPDYFIDEFIKPNDGWVLKQINLKELLNDKNFKEYYDSGDERYEDEEVNADDLYNDLVVYNGELLDGYSRAAKMIRSGEKVAGAFVLEPEDINEAKKTDYSKEKKDGLHGWFSRRGGEGNKGWVDCNTCRTVDGKKKCKACGREKGEKRSKYPSCRPTPGSCGTPGKGEKWGKTKKNESITETINEEDTEKKRIALLFIVIDNKVLLFKRSPEETTNAGKYGMLGGHIEKGETPEEALVREVKEEAGVEIEPESFKKLKTYEMDNVQLNVFHTNEFDVENIELDKKEHVSKKFFTLEELDEMSPEECIETNKEIARDYNEKVTKSNELNEDIQRVKEWFKILN